MGNCFQVGIGFLSHLDRISGNVGNDRWDKLELEFEEFLTLYSFLYGDKDRKALVWDHGQ
jgi:hypothetical protein